MNKEDLKPYFDALATTFVKMIRQGLGYQIFDPSDNIIEVMEESTAVYMKRNTGH